MIENGSLWIDTKNSKSYLKENDNWEEKDFIKELIEEKIATLQHKVADTRATIELYKNWQDGSQQQQRSRKRSFENNSTGDLPESARMHPESSGNLPNVP